MKFKKAISALLLAGTMIFQAIPAFAANTTTENMQYLNSYFEISNVSNTVSAQEFCAMLEKISGMELSYENTNTGMLQLLQPIMQASGMEELALTFPEEKYSKILADHNIRFFSLDETTAKYAACALTTGLIEARDLTNTSISKAQALRVLTAVADATGQGRNFLGYSNDADIYGKLNNMWNSFEIFSDEVLDQIGSQAVQNKVTTGYNLKKESYDARFIPELTLRYGHDDIKHANQIIGLLQSEGIVAKVQLEPKISVYEYLLDWGPVPEPEPRYEVRQYKDDFYLVYAVEYDLALEFRSDADKTKFDNLILTYAKKSGENADAQGLLYGSWWQPLYTSSSTMTGNYRKITDNVITNGEYSIHSFCLEQDAEKVKQELNITDSFVHVIQKTLWCDDAFYRYLAGNDYQ